MKLNIIRFFKKHSLTIIITIVTIIPGYHLFYLNRQKKQLSITLEKFICRDSILSNSKGIQIQYPITIINLDIDNSGNQPLQVSDFSTALTFNTCMNELLEYKIINPFPKNLHLEFERIHKNQIQLVPRLFNKKEKFSLQMIIKNKVDSLYVDCRIVGAKKIILVNNYPKKTTLSFNNLENKNLKILRATYGFGEKTIDMTDSLNLKIQNDTLETIARSTYDPYVGKVKYMNIKYIYYGFVDTISVRESKTIKLP